MRIIVVNTTQPLRRMEIQELTRTAWAVFKYCGTKTAALNLSIRS